MRPLLRFVVHRSAWPHLPSDPPLGTIEARDRAHVWEIVLKRWPGKAVCIQPEGAVLTREQPFTAPKPKPDYAMIARVNRRRR